MADRTFTAVAHAEIPTTVREQLKTLAGENDRSLAAEIRRALKAHVERETHQPTTTKEGTVSKMPTTSGRPPAA